MLPGSASEGVLCAFSSTGTDFAIATADGRVRTYDTVTGRLRSTCSDIDGNSRKQQLGGLPNGSPVEGHECVVWLDAQADTAEGRSSNPASSSRAWVAVGTSQGSVKAFDSATGELKWHTPGCNEGGVTCLAHNPGRSRTLISSGQDGHVSAIDVDAGSISGRFKASKHAIRGAAVSPDGSKLLLGSSSLSLWDAASESRMAKFNGHPGTLRAAAFAPSGAFALSAGSGETAVAVWATSVGKKAKKLGGVAVTQMPVGAPVVQLHTAAAGGTAFYAAAVTEAGEAVAWLCQPEGEVRLSVQQVARVVIGGPAAAGGAPGSKETIMGAFLEPAAAGATLLVARGSSVKPAFDRLQVSVSGTADTLINLEPSQDGILFHSSSTAAVAAAAGEKSKAVNRAAAVLGADNAGDLVKQRGMVGEAAAGRKRPEPEPDSSPAAAGAAAAAAVLDSDDEALERQEATLGQRIAAMEQRHQQGQQPVADDAAAAEADADDAMGAGPDAAGASSGVPGGSGPIKADSLGVLLQQALRSGDRALLERCLAVGTDRIINNSVRRLVPADAALLLREAVARLQSKPARGQQLAGWVRAVLLHHTAYLMAAPGATPVLTSLYQVIESRLAMQRTLLSLAGRLDLLLAQAPPTGPAGAAAADADLHPEVVYDESNSEEEVEVEDAFADNPDLDSDEYEDMSGSGMMDEDEDELADEDEDDI